MIGNIVAGTFSAGVAPVFSSYESIATTTLSSPNSTITFSSIPSTYKHLQIRVLAKSSNPSNYSSFTFTANGDTGSNYAWHYVFSDGSSAAAGAASSQNFIREINFTGGTTLTNIFFGAIIDVLDYNSTSKNKTFRMLGGSDGNGSGNIHLQSGLWMNSSNAITSLSFTPSDGYNFIANTQFALYGIKD